MSDRRRHLRASDADREQVIGCLRSAADEGRLSVDEFDERLGQALTARTYGELDAIVRDLPRSRVLIKRAARRKSVPRRSNVVKRAGGARIVLRAPRPAAVIAGALATVAVAVPFTLTDAAASRPPVIGALLNYANRVGTNLPAAHVTCTDHWTKASVHLPCTWGSVSSHADPAQIVSDVRNADGQAGKRTRRH